MNNCRGFPEEKKRETLIFVLRKKKVFFCLFLFLFFVVYYMLLLFSLLLQTHVVQLLQLCGVGREERDSLKMFTSKHFEK